MYWPSGQIKTAELGAQYGQASTYDARLRLEDRGSINLKGDTVLADHWDYYPNGTMEDQNDSAQGEFQYQYDHLNRVTSAAIPPFTEAYGYDNWGNQTSHTVTEGSSYEWSFLPTVQNRSSGPGVVYDAAGNMTADGQHSYSYDAENRVAAVLDQGVLYDYDPEGNRVATVTGATVSGTTATGGTVAAEYLYDTGGALVTTVNNAGTLVRAILRAQGQHWGDFIGAAGAGGVRTEFRLVNAVGTLVANGGIGMGVDALLAARAARLAATAEAAMDAERIANGHAFAKHAGEFGNLTQNEFKSLIQETIVTPSDVRSLSDGRTAYWNDSAQVVVIKNPNADGGTAFSPSGGKAYFNNLG